MLRMFPGWRSKKDNELTYVHYKKIHPGQTRYSNMNVIEKMNKEFAHGTVSYDPDTNVWTYKHRNGTSVFGHNDVVPVIRAPFGYVLVDGHHQVIAGMRLHSKYVPIKVIADLSDLSEHEFWQQAELHGYVYLYTTDGRRALPPASFKNLTDDSNRYFAAVTARKFFIDEDGQQQSSGAEYPLWIKVGKDAPFIEFKIANALYKAGFHYNDILFGNQPPVELIKKARKILQRANIPELKLIPENTHFEQIDLAQYAVDGSPVSERRLG